MKMKCLYLSITVVLTLSMVNCSDGSKPVAANVEKNSSSAAQMDSPLLGLARLQDYEWARSTSFDESGRNVDYREVPPWQSIDLDTLEGPGCVTRIWMALNSDADFYLRKLVLKAYWDGSETPAFEIPIGDFFGNGFAEYNHYISMVMAVKYYWGLDCYLPMPFKKSARFEVVNESNHKVKAVFHHIDYVKLDQVPDDMGYLYGWWNRECPVLDELYRVVETEGDGQYVGCFLHVQTTARGWFGEGDDHIYIDNPSEPISIGTGSEDYFGGAWMFNKAFPDMYSGCSKLEQIGELTKTSMFRFHVEAPIRFRKYFRLDMEHDRQDDYCSTAFWYQKEPPKSIPPLSHVLNRLPRGARMTLPRSHDFDAMRLQVLEGPKAASMIQSSTPESLPMSGDKRLILQASADGAQATFDLPTMPAGKYSGKVFTGRGPGGAIFSVALGEREVAFNGYSKKESLCDPIDLGVVEIKEGVNAVKIAVQGKEDQSSGYDVYLDCIELRPVQ